MSGYSRNKNRCHDANANVFDPGVTEIDAPAIIEVAWVQLTPTSPFAMGEQFEQRDKPCKPISIALLERSICWMKN